MIAKPENDQAPEHVPDQAPDHVSGGAKAEQKSNREQRQAQSLRANLQKRKDQARQRRATAKPE